MILIKNINNNILYIYINVFGIFGNELQFQTAMFPTKGRYFTGGGKAPPFHVEGPNNDVQLLSDGYDKCFKTTRD